VSNRVALLSSIDPGKAIEKVKGCIAEGSGTLSTRFASNGVTVLDTGAFLAPGRPALAFIAVVGETDPFLVIAGTGLIFLLVPAVVLAEEELPPVMIA